MKFSSLDVADDGTATRVVGFDQTTFSLFKISQSFRDGVPIDTSAIDDQFRNLRPRISRNSIKVELFEKRFPFLWRGEIACEVESGIGLRGRCRYVR